jgi:tripartite-type tricarboxylate transporter receptor subunit TctC
MPQIGRRATTAATLAVAATPYGAWAQQQSFPNRPIRVIIPFGPGGGTDNLVRVIEPHVSRALGQQLVIENRPGGASVIGTEIVARAEPDGYTLMGVDTTISINPGLFPRLPYDTLRDLAPVCLLARAPIVLVVHAGFAARSMAELVAMAKAQPGTLSYASGGNGSPTHLAGEMLRFAAGIQITHLPYRGSGPAMNDVVAGHVPMTFNGLSASGPQIQAGRVRALAVTGDRRAPAFPDVPTFAEAGLPDVDVFTNWGILTRAGTPAPIIDRLATALGEAVRRADLAPRLNEMGYIPYGGGPAEYGALIAREMERFAQVIRAAGIKPD